MFYFCVEILLTNSVLLNWDLSSGNISHAMWRTVTWCSSQYVKYPEVCYSYILLTGAVVTDSSLWWHIIMFIACTVYSVWKNDIRKLKNISLLTYAILSLVIQEASVSRGDPLYANFQYLFPCISGPYIGGTVCKNSPHFWGSDAWTTIFPADNSYSLTYVFHLLPLFCSWHKLLDTISEQPIRHDCKMWTAIITG